MRVIGHQWWWEFQYPDLGVTTGSEMHVPVGRPVAVDIESADVVHSFWFPAMGGKRDAIPGRVNHMFFTADSAGTFPGQCAELCGTFHAAMQFSVKAIAPNDYQTWVQQQIQAAKDQLQNQPPDVTATLAQLLESQEQDLILRSYETAWTEAQVGVGIALVNHSLPVGRPIAGLALSWPMTRFQITQPFGPSTVVLEPAYGPYKHFHTGIDIAAPLGTTVMAAADGVVVAVGHTTIGYGNYVVIAHGGGIATLYGHLLDTSVKVGDRVVRGQMIGLEGSTGLSTGPHVHFELRVNDQVIDPMPYLPVPGTNWSG